MEMTRHDNPVSIFMFPMLRLTIWSHPPQVYSRIGVLTLGSNLPGTGRQDVSWSGGHALLHQVHGPKPTRWAGVFSVPKAGTYVQFQQWRPTENAVTVPLTPHPSSTSKMGEHSHLRASAPPFYPWYGGAMWLQSSQIQHPHWCSHVQ